MGQIKETKVHTEPVLVWTRVLAYLAFFHFIIYTWKAGEVNDSVLKFDAFVILCWAVGSNGRSTIVDGVRAFVGGKK